MSKEIKKREDINPQFQWNMKDLYESDQQWEQEAKELKTKIDDFRSMQGTLGDSAQALAHMLKTKDELEQLMERVYVYANQKYHENTGNSIYQQMSAKAQTIMAEAGDAASYVEPELLAIPQEKLETYRKDPEVAPYDRMISQILRTREHTLTEEMEALLAKVYELAQGPSNTFSMLNNADMKFGKIKDEDGDLADLTHGRYIRFLESKDREVRKNAFQTLYAKYGELKNTLGSLMYSNVQQAVFYANVRHYPSSLAAALDGGNIPVEVYDNLITTVHEHLPLMYDYMSLRKKRLGVDELHMYDIHVPMVAEVDMKIPYERAQEIVKEGLSVLGQDYVDLLQQGFDSGWIDVYENEGKRSGAYSWGAYGTHPYVLLNYSDNLNNVFTLAHEMGHALHSYHSDKAQPYVYAGYRIFVAEVASTCNEALLIHYMMEHAKDEKEKAYLIGYFLDQFKGTLYRQTMFAEFEQKIHMMVEKGENLNGENLSQIYYELNKQYYGDGVVSDPEIALEWSRIPHFYTPFYVYQYATGFSAAIAISRKILNKEDGIVEKYKEFLSGGSSMDPVDLLKICGVDMSKPEPVKEALQVFGEYLEELKKLS